MRILQVTDFYAPVIGGLERHVQTLSHELARRGHHVVVATLAHRESPAFEMDEGVHVHRLTGWNHRLLAPFYGNTERPFHPTAPDPGVVAGLQRLIAQEQPDIIHVHSWILYSCLPNKARSKAKIIMALHDYGLTCPTKTYMHNNSTPCAGPALAKCLACSKHSYGTAKGLVLTTGLRVSGHLLHNRVDRYLAVSSAVGEASASATMKPLRPIDVVPSLIPDTVLDEAVHAGRPDFLPPDDNYILFVGALSRHKGINVLLDAYHGLSDIAPLVVIGSQYGETPDFPDDVTVVRNVPHAQVMGAWAHCAVGALPSVWLEPFGQVAVEAMICGRPLVASAVGGLRDIVVNGETGMLVPPGDADALREALRALLLDPALRARMGAVARERARLFTVSTVTNRLEEIFAETLAETGAA